MQMYSASAWSTEDNITTIQWNYLFAWILVADKTDSIFFFFWEVP